MARCDATHIINLRALEYLFDNHEEQYLEQYIATGIINRLGDDSHTREMLKYQRLIDHQETKALSAIETQKGVLIFGRDGWGMECRQAYLQYLADNYFTPQGREIGYVREYLVEHPTEELRASYRMQPHAFSLYDYAFIPHKAQYQDRALFEDQMALRSHPIQQDYDMFHSFVNMFRLTTNVHNVQVMRLLYMRALGSIPGGTRTGAYRCSRRESSSLCQTGSMRSRKIPVPPGRISMPCSARSGTGPPRSSRSTTICRPPKCIIYAKSGGRRRRNANPLRKFIFNSSIS
ncbi:MAG: DUF6047 family protein [Alistipes indistinctus]